MLNRVLNISTIAFGIVCAFVVLCTGVFAASRQSVTVNTTVQFTPGILAKVEVSVDGAEFTTLFDNVANTTVTTGQFVVNGGNVTTTTNSSTDIIFKVTNYTKDSDITATLSLATTNGVYLEQNYEEKSLIDIGGTITTNASAQSEVFHIVSLYENLPITIKVALDTTN